MRPESEMPESPRPVSSGRFRIIAIIAFVALFVILISLREIADFYTNYLWFDALDRTGVWSQVLLSRVVLALIFIAVFFGLSWLNLLIADRLAPTYRPPGPEEEVLARFHEIIGSRTGPLRFGVAALLALSVGSGAASQWRNWILFRNRVDFDQNDAYFGNDIGFYVFQLPFLSFVVNWLFTAVLIVFIITAAAHYLNGGIRMQTRGERVTPQVKAHLSVLLALMALVRAADYWLARFELTVSRSGTVDGATYTDVNAREPVFNLLVLISLFAVVLLLINIRRRGWVLPALAVGLWALVSTIMGQIYPLVIQRFTVEPAESSREEIFIERNIEATRDAFGLSDVVSTPFPYDEDLQPADLWANVDVLRNVPLLDPSVVTDNFNNEQAERNFFQFPGRVDVDRYEINGELVPVVLGARGLDIDNVGEVSWESEHLVFTHGNGLALAAANEPVGAEPDFLIGGVPAVNRIESDISLDQPRLYFGEDIDGYAIVGSTRDEVDFVTDDGERISFRYDGTGGVPIDGFIRQAAFSLRFGDIDPLISELVTEESRVIMERNVDDRVRKIAPFLEFDSEAYPVVVDGGISWVIDGYTTTNRFPYSQRADNEQVPFASDLARRSYNYVRNSVKAVVDGYDGSVTFYISDPDDPIVNAYAKAFPELFTSLSEMPEDLQRHMRFPLDLFTVQSNMWARYQLGDAAQFYENSGGWAVAQDPGGVEGPSSNSTTTASGITSRREERIDPYYTLVRLPGSSDSDFVALRSFVPFSSEDDRKELTAIIAGVGDLDDPDYGRLLQFTMPGTQADSPSLVAANTRSQEEISQAISLLAAGGTDVVLADMLLAPIERQVAEGEEPSASLLYVRPLYVRPDSGTQNPRLERVIVTYADRVVMCKGFSEAVQTLFGVWIDELFNTFAEDDDAGDPACIGDTNFAVTGPANGGRNPSVIDTPTTGDAAADALAALNEAESALAQGDLGRYQELIERATNLLRQDAENTESAEDSEPEPDAEPDEEGDAA